MATHDANAGPNLGRLSDLDEYKVADGYPDIRGWDVKTADGRTVGKVEDLIVDTQAMRVRYLDVEVDRTVAELARDAATPGDQERHTLVPVGTVRLDDGADDVLVDGYTAEQIAALPRYTGGAVTGEYETRVRERHAGRGGMTGAVAGAAAAAGATVSGAAKAVKDAVAGEEDRYAHDDYDDQRLYASRRARRESVGRDAVGQAAAAEETRRLTLAEEQLAVGKRQTQAGEVQVRKTVETEHVQERVPVAREEVTVERRPLAADAAVTAPRIGDDEIRIPVMEEQVVVEKKLVPREEIIVRKRAVTEQQAVEADVRRERLEVDDAAARVADTLDDLKDRVDGNPASRPGPDSTDRGM